MNKWLCLVLLSFLCGCFSRNAYLTQDRYNQVEIGQPISTLIQQAGQPYSIHKNKSGEQEYEYIELFSTGTRLVYENHYIFVVKDGQIIEKKMRQKQEPPYDLIYQDDPNHHYYP